MILKRSDRFRWAALLCGGDFRPFRRFSVPQFPFGEEKLRDRKSSIWLEIASTEQERHKHHFRQVTVPLFHYLQ